MKKVFTIILMALAITALFVSCDDPKHEHSYGTEWKYDDNNHWHECSCGEKVDEAAHTFEWKQSEDNTKHYQECKVCGYKTEEAVHTGKWENAADLKSNTRECTTCHGKETREGIVVTPENAQTLINSVNSGKIYFSAGEYEDLSFDQSKLVSYARKDGEQAIINVKEVASDSGVYHYYRFVSDMELIAESGVVMKGSIYCRSAHILDKDSPVDPITGTSRQYYTHVFVDGLTIDGFDFNAGQIYFSVYEPATVKNVTIKNCEFVGNEDLKTKEITAMDTKCDYENYFENFKIENNTVTDYYQGFHGQCINNITITGNEISGTKHNALAIQSSHGKFSGKILISDNTISDVSERAIRLNNGHDATIEIKNNKFLGNVVDESNQILKSSVLTNCTYSFENNTLDGKPMVVVDSADAATDEGSVKVVKSTSESNTWILKIQVTTD